MMLVWDLRRNGGNEEDAVEDRPDCDVQSQLRSVIGVEDITSDTYHPGTRRMRCNTLLSYRRTSPRCPPKASTARHSHRSRKLRDRSATTIEFADPRQGSRLLPNAASTVYANVLPLSISQMADIKRPMPASKQRFAIKTAWLETAPTPIIESESVMSVVAKLPNPSGPLFGISIITIMMLESMGEKTVLPGWQNALLGILLFRSYQGRL